MERGETSPNPDLTPLLRLDFGALDYQVVFEAVRRDVAGKPLPPINCSIKTKSSRCFFVGRTVSLIPPLLISKKLSYLNSIAEVKKTVRTVVQSRYNAK